MKLNRALPYIIYDFETGGRNPYKCQLTQIAAIVIDSRTLEIKPGGTFNTEVCPIWDTEKAMAANLDPVEDEALRVTRKTKEALLEAPNEKIAWQKFTQFCKGFNPKNDPWKAPVPCGYNINGYDAHIVKRCCESYGPIDSKGRPSIFNPIFKIDVMDLIFGWFESEDMSSISLDNIRKFFGFPQDSRDNAHDALQDVKDTGNILIKFLKFQRNIVTNTSFEGAFENAEMYIK
jgi:DNA polymerase III epsilon subunit-like protein